MKKIMLILCVLAMSCSSSKLKPKAGPGAGASATQSSTQQAADEIADPAMPATQLPPAGSPVLSPTFIP